MAAATRAWTMMSFGVAAAVGCGDPQLFLGMQTHELRGDERVLLEDSCVLVMGDRGPMDVEVTRRLFAEAASMPDDMVIERSVVDFSLSIAIFEGTQLVENKGFARFFDDENTATFEFTSSQQRTYRFRHRSQYECEAPLLPPDRK